MPRKNLRNTARLDAAGEIHPSPKPVAPSFKFVKLRAVTGHGQLPRETLQVAQNFRQPEDPFRNILHPPKEKQPERSRGLLTFNLEKIFQVNGSWYTKGPIRGEWHLLKANDYMNHHVTRP